MRKTKLKVEELYATKVINEYNQDIEPLNNIAQ